MVFRLQPAELSLMDSASHGFDLHHDYDAPPEVVHRSFLGFVGEPPWSPGFCGVDWWTPEGQLSHAVMDELYVFMSMRVHVVEHEPATRSVAYVSRWSLPLASAMVQLVETWTLPDGRTRLRYRIAYNPPRIFAPFVRPVEAIFRWWFRTSLANLARLLDAGGGRQVPVETSESLS